MQKPDYTHTALSVCLLLSADVNMQMKAGENSGNGWMPWSLSYWSYNDEKLAVVFDSAVLLAVACSSDVSLKKKSQNVKQNYGGVAADSGLKS